MYFSQCILFLFISILLIVIARQEMYEIEVATKVMKMLLYWKRPV